MSQYSELGRRKLGDEEAEKLVSKEKDKGRILNIKYLAENWR